MESMIQLFQTHFQDIKYIGLILLMSLLYALTNRPWFGKKPVILELPQDERIPLIPWTVFIYNLWYPILLAVFLALAIVDKPVFYRALTPYVAGSLFCFLIFIFYQNEVPRYPERLGKDLASRLLKVTWTVDNPYNGFPSIHCFACTITGLAILVSDFPPAFKLPLILSQLAIMVTTLTTKQHVLVDLVGGVAIGLIAWFTGPLITSLSKF